LDSLAHGEGIFISTRIHQVLSDEVEEAEILKDCRASQRRHRIFAGAVE
jgi:hypothetical protein